MHTTAELASTYPTSAGLRSTKQLYCRILRALPLEWRAILERGNQVFSVGEWVATGVLDHTLAIDQWDVYKIIDRAGVQHLLYHIVDPITRYLQPQPDSCAPWGSTPLPTDVDLGDYPLRSQVKRVHVTQFVITHGDKT